MFLGLLTLLTALTISSVAVYYSVTGLAAIFAGAYLPIIIMGASLEVGKLVTASWLHKNWNKSPVVLRAYLIIATIILMLITSIGIFGFLSRAHIEQGAPIGDIASKIEIIDIKILAKKNEIEQAKTATKNLDDVVAQFLAKGKDERSVAAANNARRNQQKERDKLTKQIDDAQKEISKLSEEKLPLTTQVRKIETEVGPIKYIAQFMYGDTSNKDILEKAVTWMILTIIFVFDPLAVLLLIASQISFAQYAEAKEQPKIEVNETVDAMPIATEIKEEIKPLYNEEQINEILRKLDEKNNYDRVEVNKADIPEEIIKTETIEPIVEVNATPVKPKRKKKEKILVTEEVTADDTVVIPEADDVKKKSQYMMKQNNQQLTLSKKI